jgi:hypothetical protein
MNAPRRSGILRIRLWATSTRMKGRGAARFAATKRVGRVNAGFYLADFSRVAFSVLQDDTY